jgi:hypothetical protein
MTSPERLASLACCRDTDSLLYAMSAVCADFGRLTKIDVFTMTEAQKRRALCFLRLESAAQEQQLMAELGASRFGDDLLVIVDLPS